LALSGDEIATNIVNYRYQQSGIEEEIPIEADFNDDAMMIVYDATAG
jgi:anti-sigma regulatory factor (Ser/Thr protein kinase)